MLERNPIQRDFYGGKSKEFSLGQVVGELTGLVDAGAAALSGDYATATADVVRVGNTGSGRGDPESFANFGTDAAVQAFNAGAASPDARTRPDRDAVQAAKARALARPPVRALPVRGPPRRPLPSNHPLRRPPVRATSTAGRGGPVQRPRSVPSSAYLVSAQNVLRRPPVRY